MRALFPTLTAAILLCSPVGAQAAPDATSVANKAFDVVILRPLGAFTTLASGVLSVPAMVVAGPGGRHGMDEIWKNFVLPPWESTFERPLGEF